MRTPRGFPNTRVVLQRQWLRRSFEPSVIARTLIAGDRNALEAIVFERKLERDVIARTSFASDRVVAKSLRFSRKCRLNVIARTMRKLVQARLLDLAGNRE